MGWHNGRQRLVGWFALLRPSAKRGAERTVILEHAMTTLKIEGLSRDFIKKRTHVTVVWADNPEKRLGLPVPFDCDPADLRTETAKAVRALIKELESATIEGP
jgi:hypothetical protein